MFSRGPEKTILGFGNSFVDVLTAKVRVAFPFENPKCVENELLQNISASVFLTASPKFVFACVCVHTCVCVCVLAMWSRFYSKEGKSDPTEEMMQQGADNHNNSFVFVL